MIHYILQIIAFQLLFLVVYDLFLRKETFFIWNRVYLLVTPILSFILPFMKIAAIRDTIPTSYTISLPEILVQAGISDSVIQGGMLQEVVLTGSKAIPLATWFIGIWSIGVVISGSYFIYKILKIQKLKKKGSLSHIEGFQLITLPDTDTAFSFFNTIFMGADLSDAQKKNIILHEIIHIKERHSLDMLFFEALRILCWFNPLVYIYQNKMMLLQEYTADAKAVSQNDKKTYYQSLLSHVFKTENISFINPFFNHSLIKKRIIMLQKSKSNRVSQLKYLVLIPLILAILIYTSCSDDSIQTSSEENIENLSYELSIGEELEGEKLKTHQAYEAFLKSHPDYVGWASKNGNGSKLIYTVHRLSEEKPKGYAELTYTTEGQSYKVYMDLGNTETSDSEDTTSITEIRKYAENDDIPYAVIDQVPIYPGCENMITNAERKTCMADKVSTHVNKNFDLDLAKRLNLEGVNRIFVQFKISKEGTVVDIKARAPHPELEMEAIHTIKGLPKMQPGQQDGTPAAVLYSLPITFRVE